MLQDLPFFSSHVGSVPGSGLEFDAFLGSEEWGNSIIAKWDNFNKGASGGPWVVPGTATVNGVHSADTANPLQKCGPEFGDWVGGFFRWVFPT